MFAVKFSCLTALALAPWAQALLLQIPVGWQSSSPANISWSNVATDPPFTLQLVNTDEFHDTFSIANNVNPTADFDAFTLPVIPQGTYTLRAINVTNAGQVYDETPSFTIQGPPDTSSHTSAASTSASASASAGSATLTVSATSKAGASGTAAGSSTGFGVTLSNSGSAASNTGAVAASSGSGSSAAATPSNFNNGAASLPHFAPWAVAALGVIAGAAAVL